MNNHDFAGLCRFIFGANWREVASDYFDINIRTIQYWVASRKAIPDDITRVILELAKKKIGELMSLYSEGAA